MGGNGKNRLELCTNTVNLPLDRVSGHRALGPTLWHHGAHNHCSGVELDARVSGVSAVQRKMRRASHGVASQYSLKLASRLQSLHFESGATTAVQLRATPTAEIRRPDVCDPLRGGR